MKELVFKLRTYNYRVSPREELLFTSQKKKKSKTILMCMGVYLPFMGSFWVGDGWGGSGSCLFRLLSSNSGLEIPLGNLTR